MARPLRIEYPGAWYHVMNRGGGRGCVFPSDSLRCAFLQLLGETHERFSAQCHAYCLMGNHYHLLLHTPDARLGRAMRHVDGVYAQRHNRLRGTDGPLFRGRYQAQLIEEGDYLWFVSRYIHRNPVEAGLCASPVDYAWSSYRYLIGQRGAPWWLQRRATLRQFGGPAPYRTFVEGSNPESQGLAQLLSEQDGDRCPPILGSEEFIRHQRQSISQDYEIPQSRRIPEAAPAETIIDALCAARGWRRQALTEGADKLQRQRRAMLMFVVLRHTPARLAQVAAAFDLHYSTAATAVSRLGKTAVYDRDVAAGLLELRALLQKMRNGQT